MVHIADDRLSALVHCDVLDPDGLIASAPVSLVPLLEGVRVTAQSMGHAGLGDRLVRMGKAMIAAHRK
jgi:hypothetical protein